MERFGKFLIILMSVMFAGYDPSPCRAQDPASPSQPSGPGSIPPPRPFTGAQPAPSSSAEPATGPPGESGSAARQLAIGFAAAGDSPGRRRCRWTRPLNSRPRRSSRPTFACRSTSRRRCGSPTRGRLIVAAAQASVWVAEAQLTRAKVLWVPQLNIGFDYLRHDGGGPDFNKGIMTAPSVNFFYGGGGLIHECRHDGYHLPAVGRAAEPHCLSKPTSRPPRTTR